MSILIWVSRAPLFLGHEVAYSGFILMTAQMLDHSLTIFWLCHFLSIFLLVFCVFVVVPLSENSEVLVYHEGIVLR